MMISYKLGAVMAALALSSSTLFAQTQILLSFTATMDLMGPGSEDPGPVSFSFLLSEASGGSLAESHLIWNDDGAPANRVIDNFSGYGITGTWQSPVDAAEGDHNTFMVFSTSGNRIEINMEGFVENDTGLFLDGVALYALEFSFEATSFGFDTALDGQTPFDYLGAYSGGPYTPSDTSYLYLYTVEGMGFPTGFTVSDLTISTVAGSAVPEPSSYAALFGGLALMLVASRRRRSEPVAQA